MALLAGPITSASELKKGGTCHGEIYRHAGVGFDMLRRRFVGASPFHSAFVVTSDGERQMSADDSLF